MNKPTNPVSIDGIEFDALIDDSRNLSAEIPDYPVEGGFVVHDSVILQPEQLDMTLYHTNTPVTWKNRFGSDPNRVQNVLARLEEICKNKEPVTVITHDKTYKNMGILSITIPTTTETGAGAKAIPISLKQIRTTETQTVTIPDSYGKSGATGTNAGTANTSVSSIELQDTSGSKASAQESASALYHLDKNYGNVDKIMDWLMGNS